MVVGFVVDGSFLCVSLAEALKGSEEMIAWPTLQGIRTNLNKILYFPLALKVRLVPVSFEDPQFSSSFTQSATLFAKYQMTIHKDTPLECDEDQVQFIACIFCPYY